MKLRSDLEVAIAQKLGTGWFCSKSLVFKPLGRM